MATAPYSGGATMPGPYGRPPTEMNATGAGGMVAGAPGGGGGGFWHTPWAPIGIGAGLLGLSGLMSGGGPDYAKLLDFFQKRLSGGEVAKQARDIYMARLAGPAFQNSLNQANLAGTTFQAKLNQNLQANGLIGQGARSGFAPIAQAGAAAAAPALRSNLYAGLDQQSWDSAMTLLAQQVDAMMKAQPGMSFQSALLSLLGMGANAGGQIIAANSNKRP